MDDSTAVRAGCAAAATEGGVALASVSPMQAAHSKPPSFAKKNFGLVDVSTVLELKPPILPVRSPPVFHRSGELHAPPLLDGSA